MGVRQLANIEKEIADEILRASGLSPLKLGLRFDRVVIRIFGGLRSLAETAMPPDMTILVTISAPIRSPARTADDLWQEIRALLPIRTLRTDLSLSIQGNSVRIRLLEHSPHRSPRLIGFAHNPGSAPQPLLDLAEHWLGTQAYTNGP